MPNINRVILVGHCGADSHLLRAATRDAMGDVTIDSVNEEAALDAVGADALLLVNRVLDGRFESGDGVELIRRLNGRGGAGPMMLISNFEDAQQRARDAGARPGFGKAQAYSEQTAQRLREAAVPTPSTSGSETKEHK